MRAILVKGSYGIIFFGLIILIFLTSCGTNYGKIVLDNTIPVEDTSVLIPYVGIRIILFNGIPVNWVAGFSQTTEVTIPAGESSLIISLAGAQSGNVTYTGGSYFLNYNFVKGHIYGIQFDGFSKVDEEQFTVIINNRTTKEKEKITIKYFDMNKMNQ